MIDNLFMLFSQINYLAVLVAGLSGMIVAGIWYNPKVMGRAWMEENNFKAEDLGSPGPKMLQGFLANLVLAFGLASFFTIFHAFGVQIRMIDGAAWGFGFAVLVHGAAGWPNYVFEGRTPMLFLIHIGNSAIGMGVMGAILATWTN